MAPRFVDASVFVHAYIESRRPLKPHEKALKAKARGIVSRINDGEPVVTSSVHLAEVANVLEDWRTQEDAHAIESGLLSRETVAILAVGRSEMVEALDLAGEAQAGLTDALAAILMRRNDLKEVYSFDHDFDRFADIKRIAS